ncbi:MAG: hypothetical protein J1E06_08320 [Acutalibacter sp.]|nr:hypothetical protein [Acutalibacter sp.]
MDRDREYVRRSQAPSPTRRRGAAPPNRYNRKKSGPPPFLYLCLILIIVIVLAVILWKVFSGGGEKPDPTPASDSSAPTSSTVSEPDTSDLSSVPGVVTPSPEPSIPPEKIPDGPAEQLGALLKIGDTGYEYYNFVESYANNYITTVCDAGDQLGSINLYNIIIPTSMDIMLPESYIEENQINSQDQKKAIDYMYNSINAINPNVKTVPVFDALKLHNNDYIYFRTDHHWTQLGAYYAYVEFCKAKGIAPTPLEDYEKSTYEGFLGSFYSDNPNSEMENHPDVVEAYRSGANASLTFTQADGATVYDWPVIQDGTDYATTTKYLIFCAADQPYEEIVNSDLSDGSACLVVKESFGNVFIPFLVDHYETVYVVDYRYYGGDISDLAQEKGVSDVILINNISMTRNEDLIDSLSYRF